MGKRQSRKFLLALITITIAIVPQCCSSSTRPSSTWLWPDQGNQERDENKTRNVFSVKTRGTGTADSRIRPKALFTFGGISTLDAYHHQTRALGIAPTSQTRNCTCVPFYHCSGGQVVSDGSGIIDIRQGWPCLSVLEVCCKNPLDPLTPAPAPNPTQTSKPGNVGGSSSGGAAIPGVPHQCGTLHPNGVHARILGFKDSETQFGEYPWQAAILEQKLIGGMRVFKFVCGAALVWTLTIVTVAHCVQGREAGQLVIRLGEWDTNSINEILPHQDIWGKEIVVHPLYYSGAYVNDIALVFLQTPAILSLHIGTICLPFASPQPSYEGTSCYATGWGKRAFGEGGQYQAILHEVELPIVAKNVCATLLRNTSLGSRFNFHSSYLCAGGQQQRDTCDGDGGGPLVCPSIVNPWRYVLAGITSWGIGCGTSGVPGVYTDISLFTTWIQIQIALRVPLFNPRELGIEPNGTGENSTTKAPRPQQYL